ncbi:MAG: hypothetical protein O3A74_01200 [archaeon]|nr:hypothetical protein [archaeon]MDA0843022.1 hypothetical protein [archaeon]
MFGTVEMSRMTLAATVDQMDNVLNECSRLGCVHIEDYVNFEDGIEVGRAVSNDGANKASALLAKVRAARSHYKPHNTEGPISTNQLRELFDGDFAQTVEEGLEYATIVRDNQFEMASIEEQLVILRKLEPLDIEIELLVGTAHIDMFVAEVAKASKAMAAFAGVGSDIRVESYAGVVVVACAPSKSTEVQMILGNLGARALQIPSGHGKPSEIIKDLSSSKVECEKKVASAESKGEQWASKNGRLLVAMDEYLTRIDSINTAPTMLAVSDMAFVLDAWVPASQASYVQQALSSFASHIEIEAHVDDHHGHHHSHHEPTPPVAYENGSVSKPFELMVDLVGRPKYGSIDPTFFIMMTFPFVYGLILGDFGYGLIIYLLGLWLGTKPFAVDPVAKNGITILKWMGIWCIIWGLIFAEGFGFVWDNSTSHKTIPILVPLYDWTYAHIHFPHFMDSLLNLNLHVPFHRADDKVISDYVLISIYLGVVHLLFGFIIGFINAFNAHGIGAAFFEKGSFILILIGGFLHARQVVGYGGEMFILSAWTGMVIAGVFSLIIGLAIYEKFGWAGGVIMGPIETFGLLANTLSYLRVMAVGVAGVKIAEISITIGWDIMIHPSNPVMVLVGLVLFVLIQAFALALGLLSPSIHAARLHFVEWMGKFHDGSGRLFTPLGGRTLHVEGQS